MNNVALATAILFIVGVYQFCIVVRYWNRDRILSLLTLVGACVTTGVVVARLF